MQPAPGPHTLRMGQQDSDAHDHGYNPLQMHDRVSPHGAVSVSEEGH
jgi:hypothetical protein